MKSPFVGLDFGSSWIRVYTAGRGVTVREPSLLLCDAYTGKVIKHGRAVTEMIGRTPPSMKVVRPAGGGVPADPKLIGDLVKKYLDRAAFGHLVKPDAAYAVPEDMTDVERKSVVNMLKAAGAGRVCLVAKPFAAALGAGNVFTSPHGTMTVDLGGGSSSAVIISMSGLVTSSSVRIGSDSLTDALIRWVRRERGVEIGFLTADRVKRTIGSALPVKEEFSLMVAGRSLLTSEPVNIEISGSEVLKAITPELGNIAEGIGRALTAACPETAADVGEDGIILTGGGSLLRGMPEYLSKTLGVPVRRSDNPEDCTAIGLGRTYKNSLHLAERGLVFEQL